MKKLFLFLFASLLSVSIFAENDGSTKAKAVPYNWDKGIFVESTAGVGKWYVVNLLNDMTPQGPFNHQGKTTDGKTNINVMVVNPLDDSANIDVVAYIGDNETTRNFTLAPGGSKSMTFGAGMFVKMGIDRVYLYLVMDVTVTKEEAEQYEAVHVNVTPVENENSVVFIPDTFRWAAWPNKTLGITIPANKETWVMFDFATHSVTDGNTYKFYVEKDNATPITIDAGVSYDCPSSNIQEQSSELKSAATEKVLDEAKLSMIPDTIYLRIKSPQELRIYAEQVGIPAPTGPAIFNIKNGNDGNPAIEVKLWDSEHPTDNVYTLDANHLVYSVDYATLQAEEYYYRQIEVTNNGSEEVTIVGKASKTPDADGNVYSVATKTVTIPAGQTYTKKIDKTMQSVVGSGAGDKIYALGPEFPDVTFKLTEHCTETNPCVPAQAILLTIPETGPVDKDQAANSTKWYKVDITAAKSAKADIRMTMTASEKVDLTVDIAAECALGEPTQSYTGSSATTVKTLSYSLIKDVVVAPKEDPSDPDKYYVYVRVNTNKDINVAAELLSTKTWNGTKWSGDEQAPTMDEAARIEGNLTIHDGETLHAKGLTLTSIPASDPIQYYTITIEQGGKLIVGEEGIKGSEVVEQIIIEDGGMLLISPSATTNNKPFVTAEKGLKLGLQETANKTQDEYHEFIALPIENRQAGVELPYLRYVNWGLYDGWGAEANGFRRTFEGYNVFIPAANASAAATLTATFKGQLAANKNVRLDVPQWGWYAYGNSWTAPIALADIYDQFPSGIDNEKAVHFYVNEPTDFGTPLGLIQDNYYIPATEEIAANLGKTEINPMQGFFLYTEGSYSINLNYSKVFNANKGTAPAPKRKVNSVDNRTMVAAVLSDGNFSDFVYMIEGEATNAHKMIGNGLALYAEDGLAQVANDNLIGTILSIKTNNATEYTLSFGWLKGETLYIKDLANGNIIAMTADSRYTFTAEPNSVSERFQVIGRNDAPTAIENSEFIEGANKFIENGKVVIIKNGVKYNVLGAELK